MITDFMAGVYKTNIKKINKVPLALLDPMKRRRTRFLSVKAMSNDKMPLQIN